MTSKDENIEILISYVRHYRLLANLTQKDVAKYIGITEQRYASLETNKHKSNILKCLKIAKCLNTTVDNLYKFISVTASQYNIIRCITLDGHYSIELKDAFDKLDKYKSEKIELTKSEETLLAEFIRKNSVLRYGNILESFQFERINNLFKIH